MQQLLSLLVSFNTYSVVQTHYTGLYPNGTILIDVLLITEFETWIFQLSPNISGNYHQYQ